MIPKKLKDLIKQDPFYNQCCLTGRDDERIEWHHTFLYSGRKIEALWAIVPVTFSLHSPYGIKQSIHREGFKNKQRAKLIALNRAIEMYGSLELLQRVYPKKDWEKEYKHLKSLPL